MNSLQTLLATKSILAAVVAVSGMAAPAVSHALTAPGGPSAGVVCRSGYSGSQVAGAFKCSKTSTITVVMECANPTFDKYVVRAQGSLGSTDGLDICIKKNGVQISSTDDISLLTKGGDYVFVKVSLAKVAEKTIAQDLAEAATFGGSANDVDTTSGEPFVEKNSGGDSKDSGKATLTHFTFAVPGFGGVIINPGPFVPRPLP